MVMQVLCNGDNDVVAQSFPWAKSREMQLSIVVCEPLQAATERSHPYLLLVVTVERVDVVVGKGGFWRVPVCLEVDG